MIIMSLFQKGSLLVSRLDVRPPGDAYVLCANDEAGATDVEGASARLVPTLALGILPPLTLESEEMEEAEDAENDGDDDNELLINDLHAPIANDLDQKSLAEHRRDILALLDGAERLQRGTSWSELKSVGRRLSATSTRLVNRRSFPESMASGGRARRAAGGCGPRSCDASGEESDALPLLDRMSVSLHQTPSTQQQLPPPSSLPLVSALSQRKRRLPSRVGPQPPTPRYVANGCWLQNTTMTTSIYEPQAVVETLAVSPQLMTRSLNAHQQQRAGKRRLLRRRLIRRAASDAGACEFALQGERAPSARSFVRSLARPASRPAGGWSLARPLCLPTR